MKGHPHTVGIKTNTDQHAALPSDGFEIHDVEHTYNKGHTEGIKKVHMHVLSGELRGHGSICPQSHRGECLWPEASTRAPQKQSIQISLLCFFNTGYQIINKNINVNFFSLIKCIYNHSLLYGKHLPENVHL